MITPNGERVHIGFFGKRNAGKSSLINCVTGQELSVVSDVKGTTTDPVQKQMELLPLGPVTVIDTPGYDDIGNLGAMRVRKTLEVLAKTDIAVLVIDAGKGKTEEDAIFLSLFREKKIPFLVVYNKCELNPKLEPEPGSMAVSAKNNIGIFELKEKIASLMPEK
ncbi:MAG: GTP-binding protein, partial [Clostridia bacterium]|nr:GTP-binding protein [Clostridia bacterium]